MATRPLPAGPAHRRWRAPQSQHRVEARFAVHLGGRDPYAVVDDAFLPLLRHPRRRCAAPTGAPTGQALRSTGAEVSAVTREAGALARAGVQPDARAPTTVDHRGPPGLAARPPRPPAPGLRGVASSSAPWQIATAALA